MVSRVFKICHLWSVTFKFSFRERNFIEVFSRLNLFPIFRFLLRKQHFELFHLMTFSQLLAWILITIIHPIWQLYRKTFQCIRMRASRIQVILALLRVALFTKWNPKSGKRIYKYEFWFVNHNSISLILLLSLLVHIRCLELLNRLYLLLVSKKIISKY